MSSHEAMQHALKQAEYANKALAIANELVQGAEKEAAASQAYTTELLQKCAKLGLINKNTEKAARARLQTRSGALEVALNLIDHFNTKLANAKAQLNKTAAAQLGTPAGVGDGTFSTDGEMDAREKRASMTSGYRRGDDDYADEATLAMARRLGIQIGGTR